MTKAYPKNKFVGFDIHEASIDIACERAREEGLTEDRLVFKVASSTDFPSMENGYDLVTFFNCLHDMIKIEVHCLRLCYID